jgi:type IV pilus assembly protein PilC
LANFRYVAKDKSGKTISGLLEAKDRGEVVNFLGKKSLVIISVIETVAGTKWPGQIFSSRKTKTDDLVVFSRQLATMVDASIPLVTALDILGEQAENAVFGEVIKKVRNDVEAGASLSDALSRSREVFSPLFVNMAKAGESSGMLDEILDRVATYMEKTSVLQKKIKTALIYPAVVSVMAFGITLLLMLKVVPVFKEIFSGFGAELPKATLTLIAISDGLRRYFFLAAAAVAAAVFLAARYISTDVGRLKFDSLLLRLPVFGALFRKVAISKFTRTLSTLIKSGVSILAALEIVAKTAGNKAVELAVNDVHTNVREGENIAEPLARSGIFPPMVIRMVSVGEKTGELEKMLSKIADFYDEQVDAAVAGLTSMIEPLIIAFLGIVIGAIVVCMFMPVFTLTAVVGG